MSSFVLKIIALTTMFCDHLGYCIYGKLSWMNYIGRLSFPIFAFQISEGYIHTKNVKKYFLRLLIFAFISQIPFNMYEYALNIPLCINVFFTLLLGLLTIFVYDKANNKIWGLLLMILLSGIAEYFSFDYGAFGVIVVFLFYLLKENKLIMSLSFILSIAINYFMKMCLYGFNLKYILLALCAMFSIIFICLYNNKKGPNIKYLLYIFYPLHLLILSLLLH